MSLDLLCKIFWTPFAPKHAYASSLLGRMLLSSIHSIARASCRHSPVFSARCSRPLGVREQKHILCNRVIRSFS
jgi:hypothetical protein